MGKNRSKDGFNQESVTHSLVENSEYSYKLWSLNSINKKIFYEIWKVKEKVAFLKSEGFLKFELDCREGLLHYQNSGV